MKKKTKHSRFVDDGTRTDDRLWAKKSDLIALSEKFLLWAKQQANNESARFLVSERFWLDNDVHPDQPAYWSSKYPEFKKNYEMGKAYIGVRKLEGVYAKELEPNKTTFTMHQYLNSWKKAESYHSDLKNVKDAMAQLLGVEFDVPKLEGKE